MEQTLFRFANFSTVGSLEFEGIAATDELCSDGYALSIPGGNISRFSGGKGPLLLEHKTNQIVGTASLRKTQHAVMLRGKFASPGVSQVADEARRLLKDGVLRGLSISVSIHKSEPMSTLSRKGRRATEWTAMEVSVCSVPLDAGAVVTQRALSEMLARSGRRLSAETERCLRAALESHTAAMKSHSDAIKCSRETRDMIEELLDREDSGGMTDESDRARRQFELEIRKRRWPPGTLDTPASRTRSARQLALAQRELVIRR